MTLADWPFIAAYFAAGVLFAVVTRRSKYSLAERLCAWPFYALAFAIAAVRRGR